MLCLTFSPSVLAQQGGGGALPSFAFPRDDVRERTAKENWRLEPVPTPVLKNAYLNDILSLQDQINLIEKLSEREKILSDLGQTYHDLGIAFTPPPPPREICEKIPPSVVCVQAYPDLFKIAMPIEEPAQAPPIAEEPNVPPVIQENPAPVPEDTGPTYRWTDVTCAGGACRAVLVNESNGRTRRTVSEGDALDGGAIVAKISFEGVRISRNGAESLLMPAVAPSRGGSASPLFAAGRVEPQGQPRRRPSGPASAGKAKEDVRVTPPEKLEN